MRPLLAALALVTLAACGPRQVEVRTAPTSTTSQPAIHMTNNLSSAVNVYVVSGGTDMFVRQVGANTTEHLVVSGVSAGSTVTLKATTIDGSRTYTKDNVVLTDMVSWQVP